MGKKKKKTRHGSDPGNDSNTWPKLLICALGGALLAGSVQYVINERQFDHRLNERRAEVVSSYLKEQLQRRRAAYNQIRRAVGRAIQEQTHETRVAAVEALQFDMPFFEPRVNPQLGIKTAREFLLTYFREPEKQSHILSPSMLLDGLNADFQRDLTRIEELLLAVRAE